jgi:L-rhamnono-1,4-lactonase
MANTSKDHLCKPDLEQVPTTAAQKDKFNKWKAAITKMAAHPNVYMKLSGGFSEMGFSASSLPVDKLVERVSPWFEHVLTSFTANRIMYGSDWPVTNMGGGAKALGQWRAVVAELMNKAKLSEADKARIWGGTAIEAYRLKLK